MSMMARSTTTSRLTMMATPRMRAHRAMLDDTTTTTMKTMMTATVATTTTT